MSSIGAGRLRPLAVGVPGGLGVNFEGEIQVCDRHLVAGDVDPVADVDDLVSVELGVHRLDVPGFQGVPKSRLQKGGRPRRRDVLAVEEREPGNPAEQREVRQVVGPASRAAAP